MWIHKCTHTHTHTVAKQHREGDAVAFLELNQRLSRQDAIQNRPALLTFLNTLTSDCKPGVREYSLPNEVCVLYIVLASHAVV